MTLCIKEWIDNLMSGQSELIYEFNEIKIKYIWNVINSSPKDGVIINLIGVMNQYGYGIQKNIPNAIKYYKLAMVFKNIDLIDNLIELYGSDVDYKNIPEAIKYCQIMIKLKNDRIIYDLACIYMYDVDYKNIPYAIKYYKMAIELKHICNV